MKEITKVDIQNSDGEVCCEYCKEPMELTVPYREDHAHYYCKNCNIQWIIYYKDLIEAKQ